MNEEPNEQAGKVIAMEKKHVKSVIFACVDEIVKYCIKTQDNKGGFYDVVCFFFDFDEIDGEKITTFENKNASKFFDFDETKLLPMKTGPKAEKKKNSEEALDALISRIFVRGKKCFVGSAEIEKMLEEPSDSSKLSGEDKKNSTRLKEEIKKSNEETEKRNQKEINREAELKSSLRSFFRDNPLLLFMFASRFFTLIAVEEHAGLKKFIIGKGWRNKRTLQEQERTFKARIIKKIDDVSLSDFVKMKTIFNFFKDLKDKKYLPIRNFFFNDDIIQKWEKKDSLTCWDKYEPGSGKEGFRYPVINEEATVRTNNVTQVIADNVEAVAPVQQIIPKIQQQKPQMQKKTQMQQQTLSNNDDISKSDHNKKKRRSSSAAPARLLQASSAAPARLLQANFCGLCSLRNGFVPSRNLKRRIMVTPKNIHKHIYDLMKGDIVYDDFKEKLEEVITGLLCEECYVKVEAGLRKVTEELKEECSHWKKMASDAHGEFKEEVESWPQNEQDNLLKLEKYKEQSTELKKKKETLRSEINLLEEQKSSYEKQTLFETGLLKNSKSSLEKETARLQGKIEELKETESKLNADIKDSETKLSEIRGSEKEFDEKNRKIAELTSELKALEQELLDRKNHSSDDRALIDDNSKMGTKSFRFASSMANPNLNFPQFNKSQFTQFQQPNYLQSSSFQQTTTPIFPMHEYSPEQPTKKVFAGTQGAGSLLKSNRSNLGVSFSNKNRPLALSPDYEEEEDEQTPPSNKNFALSKGKLRSARSTAAVKPASQDLLPASVVAAEKITPAMRSVSFSPDAKDSLAKNTKDWLIIAGSVAAGVLVAIVFIVLLVRLLFPSNNTSKS